MNSPAGPTRRLYLTIGSHSAGRRGTFAMSVRVVSLLCLVLTACANAPARIYDMDEATIRGVPDENLCFAVALALRQRNAAPGAQAERQRRGLKCDAEIAENVSNCSGVAITNADQEPTIQDRGNYYMNTAKFTVKNSRSSAINFRIIWRESVSKLLSIPANSQQSFDAEADAGSPVGRNGRLKPTRAILHDCTVARGASQREVRW